MIAPKYPPPGPEFRHPWRLAAILFAVAAIWASGLVVGCGVLR